MSLFKSVFLNKDSLAESDKPVFTLLYSSPPAFDPAECIKAIAQYEPLHGEPTFRAESNSMASLMGMIRFDNHAVGMVALPSPLPQSVVEQCIYPSPWDADFKELLASHLSTLILSYQGDHPDPVEQYLALSKAAACLYSPELLGVVNEPAWTCFPGDFPLQLMKPEWLGQARQSPPLVLWTGFVRIGLGDEEWMVTRGNHLFGLPDFAMRRLDHDPVQVHDLFHELFHYFYFAKKLPEHGDGINIDEQNFYVFLHPHGRAEHLRGMGELFVVEEMEPEEWAEAGGFDPGRWV
ncbi:MAG: hypothetical protein RMM53_12260 [Bacteroidia bacterium]|nr:hypothetical protein [Bacteroidia bacterium]MDW8334979.1 hypothetical protein [Bacteroidia bacterium]